MLVRHHSKYKEIHGIDEVVMMDKGEHDKLHKRLRKEGKCNIPVDKLRMISHRAMNRDRKRIHFTTTMLPYVNLHEEILYFPWTGNVCCTACFQASKGKHLRVVDI